MPKGMGVSAGIGFAQAMLWRASVAYDYVPRKSGQPNWENDRFEKALTALLNKTEIIRQKTARRFGEGEAVIFEAYSLMLSDEENLLLPLREKIRHRNLSAEYAVAEQFEELAQQFLDMDDDYLRQRSEDVYGLRDQLLAELHGLPPVDASHFDRPTVVVAQSLTPTDIASLDLSRLEGIVCEAGSYSSHMSIIARTLGVPAVVAADNITRMIRSGDVIALDGDTGEIWINPKEPEIATLQARAEAFCAKQESAQMFRGRPTISTDGRRIELGANIGQLDDVDTALAADAEAVGMFRTELLHTRSKALPSEEEQFQAYLKLIQKMNGKAAVVRTFDDGGNKPVLALKGREEENPVLGYRGIRMSLGRPSFFRTQLRALLRASAYGPLKVLFPMISQLDELHEAKQALEHVKEELAREGVAFDEKMPVGVLVSVPAAALMSEALAKEVDFLSVGINDLIQFTLAIDRGSPSLGHLYHQYHPAVLRLLKWTVDSAHSHGIPCFLCGEAPGQQQALPLMMGLGFDGFSLNPSLILPMRQRLNALNYAECQKLAEEVLNLHTTAEVEKHLALLEEW